ncbi:MAG: transcriptional regulator with XRE-family HTH domain [Parvicella sp.]|jgi:transcriptional regulator with XRE-family HTH domain
MSNIGERISQLRKRKNWSQTELSNAIKASREAIGKYERNESVPSVEVAKKIADIFEVSLDYLVNENETVVFDKQTVKRLQDIENLPEDDKEHIFYTLDGLITAAKLKTI